MYAEESDGAARPSCVVVMAGTMPPIAVAAAFRALDGHLVEVDFIET